MICRNKVIERLQREFDDQPRYLGESYDEPIDPIAYRTAQGDTLLHIAAVRGDAQSVKDLVDLGVPVDAVGDMGQTALHCAARFRHEECMRVLRNAGASIDIRDEFGRCALES